MSASLRRGEAPGGVFLRRGPCSKRRGSSGRRMAHGLRSAGEAPPPRPAPPLRPARPREGPPRRAWGSGEQVTPRAALRRVRGMCAPV